MDLPNPQTTPPPGRTLLRIGDRVWDMDDEAWERWVRFGRVPPDSLVLSLQWTRGVWRRAESLEVYHLFLPSTRVRREVARARGEEEPTPTHTAAGLGRGILGEVPAPASTERRRDRGEPPPAEGAGRESGVFAPSGLPRALWGPGVSVTQALLVLNIAVSAMLVLLWGDDYTERLWAFSGRLRGDLLSGWVPVLFIPLFLHASVQHLVGNLVGLTAGGAAVEEFYGRTRTLVLYLSAGICGALLSLLREKPVLSVGASGAIMGLYGVTLVFLLRYRGRFSERQKIKTTRIYLPLLVLALFPSLFMADIYSHVGGFLGGVLLALVIPPDPRRTPWRDATARDLPAPPQDSPQGGSRVRP